MSLSDQETESTDLIPSFPDDHSLEKLPYESPALIEWGTIHELTAGPISDIQDDGFLQGSGPQ